MFDSKKTSLYEKKETVVVDALKKDANIFEKEMFEQEHQTLSGNGSVKLTSTGNPILDDFGSLSIYRAPRDPKEAFATMATLYAYNSLLALKETCYLRMITRDTRYLEDIFKGSKGQGLRHEFNCRMIWLAKNHPDQWKENLLLFISIGSWQDLFDQMELDLSYVHNGRNHILDWKWIASFLANYLQDESQTNLIKKYLPTIKNAKSCHTLHSQCTNYIGKYLATSWFNNTEKDKAYAQYRRLKSSGTAHSWQQAISRQDYSHINFNAIAGRALNWIANSKFLENHNLEEQYEQWITSQPIAKFTGFVYELFAKVTGSEKTYQIDTINKQFMQLVEEGKKGMQQGDKYIVCIDSSGSMGNDATGTTIPCLTVAKAIGLYMSYLLEGTPFADTFMEFETHVHLHSWSHYISEDGWRKVEHIATTPYEKFKNPLSGYWGSTDFVGCAEELVRMLQKGYKEEDFPTGLIAVSDGEFNRTENKSNFQAFRQVLRNGGFSKEYCDNFKIVLWDLSNSYYGGPKQKFEELADCPFCYQISGLDPAALSFLFGKEVNGKVFVPKTAEELMMLALGQDILNLITV